MRDDDLPHLSPAELDVMKVLWDADRLSAREIHDRVADRHGWAASTTRTVVERLVGKGIVAKEEFHGLNLYRAAVGRARGLARLVRDFADRVVGTSPAPVLSLFADAGTLDEDELRQLQELVGSDEEGSE